jgi:hypothetical protein
MTDSDDKKINVVILGAGPSMTKQLAASMMSRLDQVMIVDRPKEDNTVYIHAHRSEPIPNCLIRHNTHGAYRQFEKLDKREHFQRATSRNFRKL